MKLLWVISGSLMPLDAGGKIRSFNILKELAKKHDTTLFVFIGDGTEKEHRQLEQYFSKVICEPIEIPGARGAGEALNYAANLLTLQPYSMAKYNRPNVKRALAALLRREKFDVLVCDYLFTAGAIPWDVPCPKVVFTHNVEEQIWRRHFEVTRNPVWKAVSWREYRCTGRAERKYLNMADEVLAVSQNDSDHFAKYLDSRKLTVIPTGVDVDYFHPGNEPEEPESLVFTGSMDWMPNEDAIHYFCAAIFPLVKRHLPKTQLYVVGRKPSDRLKSVGAADASVHITGAVEDIRPYVRRAPVYVVPLRIGGGTRIKIFEAMAMGKAIVSTTIGAEGLPVEHGRNILLADKPESFAAEIIWLLSNPERRQEMGSEARRLVEFTYGWATAAKRFDQVLERAAKNGSWRLET